jgi:hypothetical protein
MIETLAGSYVALEKEADADVRAEVNALLLNFISKKPKALQLALVAFVNNVYAKDEGLFLAGFMPHFLKDLIKLEQKSENGAIAEVFVSFCLEGCFFESSGGNFADRRSRELSEWLSCFKRGLSTKSVNRVNEYAKGWHERTRQRWYEKSGYRPSWISIWLSKMKDRLAKKRRRILVPAFALAALGLVGWLVYPQLVRWLDYHGEPVDVEQGKRLSYWLEQYENATAEQESDVKGRRMEAQTAIQSIGTNALLSLVRMVRTKDSAIDNKVESIFRLRSENNYHARSIQGFAVLGEAAKPAVDDLVKSLGDKSPNVQACAANCLGLIGPVAKDAFPHLVNLLDERLTNNVVSLREGATNAVLIIGLIGPKAKDAIPDLVNLLNERLTNNVVSLREGATNAVLIVGLIGPKAKDAIPDLVNLLNERLTNNVVNLREGATNAVLSVFRVWVIATAKSKVK